MTPFRTSSFARAGKTVAAALAAVTLLATVVPSSAEAGWRHRRGWHGGYAAAGIVGGLALGALAAGAYRPYYAAPVYGECWTERRRVWNGYRHVLVRERFCN